MFFGKLTFLFYYTSINSLTFISLRLLRWTYRKSWAKSFFVEFFKICHIMVNIDLENMYTRSSEIVSKTCYLINI